MLKKLTQPRGFTLIELLVVITIMVILIGIAAVSYTTVQRNTRDAQRQSDLQKIAAALEEFYSDNREYPAVATLEACLTGNSGCVLSTLENATANEYLNELPVDPQTEANYTYTVGGNFQNYTLSASFEGTTPAGYGPLVGPSN